MTIKDYYDNYKKNSKYPVKLPCGFDLTIDDFYSNCISLNLLSKVDVIAWHKMLLEYVERDDAVYWIRYYESGNKTSGRWNNRRGCFTRFSDGFSYVFVSNYDVHEIFNMIRLGVVPSSDEFTKLMVEHTFPLHYDTGKSCEESDIASYPNVGSYKGGVLTFNHWYLAHINGIKTEFLKNDGRIESLSDKERDRIFPLGELDDWKEDGLNPYKIRNLNYSLTDEEKNIVKAHFLRFVDPLNYYVTPGKNYQNNPVASNIGEYELLNKYMNQKYNLVYGSDVMNSFLKKALVPQYSMKIQGDEIINISYGNRNTATGKKNLVVKKKPVTIVSSDLKIGQYAKTTFIGLLENGKISLTLLKYLMDKDYCSKELGISYPLIVEVGSSYDTKRYYKDIVLGKYLVCSQWYEKSRNKIAVWLENNKL